MPETKLELKFVTERNSIYALGRYRRLDSARGLNAAMNEPNEVHSPALVEGEGS